MQPLWLRYLRLWSAALEARLEIALTRWGSRMLHFLLIAVTVGLALLLMTAALIAWLIGASAWAVALLGGAAVWGALAILLFAFGKRLLNAVLLPRGALYRLRLAQSGLRLIETKLVSTPPSAPPLNWLSRAIRHWLWHLVRRWLRRWLPFL